MTARLLRSLAILLLPLALASCLFTPGKFVSTLSVNADRTFAFTFVGEVIALDPSDAMAKGMTGGLASEAKPGAGKDADPATKAEAKAETERKNRAVAEALSKEVGYRKVAYLGDGKFMIDYAINGTLDHNFVYPFNLDAQAIIPFIALELRAGGTVRMKAPAYAKSGDDMSPMGMPMQSESKLDGVFTLDTDAEIVSQNNEGGVTTAGARKTIVWKATPLTKDAPTAVLRFAR